MSSPSSIDVARPGTASWRVGCIANRAVASLERKGKGSGQRLWNTLSKADAGRESAAYIVGTFGEGAPGNGLKRAPSSSTPIRLPVLGLKESAGYFLLCYRSESVQCPPIRLPSGGQ